ncbi:hydrolase [Loigolactobacillus binensis]|uniref:Hydrolase n=1 Tax=Loigolactobacillus binensis TaxID=2559922 RepID=A0ABW3ECC1_9LACO|nr:hydrolase [Loigolactobacillus binensis]
MKPQAPEIMTELRQDLVKMPAIIRTASGIIIFGKRIRSIIFSTDMAIIKNTNADAVIAVYPFTPHPAIMQGISMVADIPVFAGVGGGLTHGQRSVNISLFAESLGSLGVVVNAPTPIETISAINEVVDIPIILTVVTEQTELQPRLAAGVDIVNISGGQQTAQIVTQVRQQFPDLPIIATGGKTTADIAAVIAAGANAVTYTPPSNGELFSKKMARYRAAEIARTTKK